MALAAASRTPLVDTHIHLFDPAKFPYHPRATYKPPAETLENYVAAVKQIGLDHSIVVHPEPYQDDHAYLDYCFAHEPKKGFFKGTCLFDAHAPDTPARMQALMKKWPGRVVALRVHSINKELNHSGAIRDRDLNDPRMASTWAAAHKLGLAIQMHMTPMWAPAVARLIEKTPGVAVVIDHLCRYAQGTPAEYEEVLKLAKKGRVYMKFSGLGYSSKEKPPHRDLIPLCKRIYDAFGPNRIVWGGLGMTPEKYKEQRESFETIWAALPEQERARIRGGNAAELYHLG
jgi:predicted TIM-barrel fold metal-dependent hydrolase